jgi:hypothetical protein
MTPELEKKLDAIITKTPGQTTSFIDMWKCHKEIIESIPNHEEFLTKEIECVRERYKQRLVERSEDIFDSFHEGYSLRNEKSFSQAWWKSTAKEKFDEVNEILHRNINEQH